MRFVNGVSQAQVLEERRRLAVDRVLKGWTQTAVADVLGVNRVSVTRWMQRYRRKGARGLAARPRPGQKPKLTPRQARVVLGWFKKSPTQFGFATELWTGQRVAQLIERRFGVHFHPHYMLDWLRQRKITSQKPRRQPRERDERKIQQWLKERWPELKKKSRPERICS